MNPRFKNAVKDGVMTQHKLDEIVQPKAIQLQRCGYCNVKEEYMNAFKKCARCKVARYCCVEHQKLAWPVHKKEKFCLSKRKKKKVPW